MKDGNRTEFTEYERKIKECLESDISRAASNAGSFAKIAQSAYEPQESVKPNRMPFIFSAVCAVLTIAALAVMDITSGDLGYSYRPGAACSKIETAGAEAEENSETETEENAEKKDVETLLEHSVMTEAEIINTDLRVSTDENGNAASNDYSLSYDFFFPEKRSMTSYGTVYTYIICEGELLESESKTLFYKAGEVSEMKNINFKMKDDTSSSEPKVTVISCFVRIGARTPESCTAVGTYTTVENAEYTNEETAEENTDIAEYIYEQDRVETWLIKESDETEPMLAYSTDYLKTAGEADMVVIRQQDKSVSAVSGEISLQYPDSLINFEYAEMPIGNIEELESSANSFVLAAVIPKGGAQAQISPVYTAETIKESEE